MGFTAGQQAYSDYFELTLEEQLVKRLQSEAILQGMGCNPIQGGAYNICFVICTRYNFWEDCSEIPGGPPLHTAGNDNVWKHPFCFHPCGLVLVLQKEKEGGGCSTQIHASLWVR